MTSITLPVRSHVGTTGRKLAYTHLLLHRMRGGRLVHGRTANDLVLWRSRVYELFTATVMKGQRGLRITYHGQGRGTVPCSPREHRQFNKGTPLPGMTLITKLAVTGGPKDILITRSH